MKPRRAELGYTIPTPDGRHTIRKSDVMLRYLNMFVLIGIALILISLVGFATANKFLTEPGQTPNPNASLIYLGAGVLMLFNGLLSIMQTPHTTVRPVNKDGASPDTPKEPTGSTQPEVV
jgi:hypothetical protein